ncbi:MAG: hypothetical protein ACLTDR_07265 [Adlercreutzia equolifaciens]
MPGGRKRPLIVKLTPNVTVSPRCAKAAEAAGADGISLINTLLGMAVDARTRRPKLARVVGGYSGPAVKPRPCACVAVWLRPFPVPVLGMGGVTTGEDAVEFMLAGATAVAVGTASFCSIPPPRWTSLTRSSSTRADPQGVKDVSRADRSPAMLTAFDSVPARDRVIVALDCDAWEAIALADKLEGHAKWLKIGMTLYSRGGPGHREDVQAPRLQACSSA